MARRIKTEPSRQLSYRTLVIRARQARAPLDRLDRFAVEAMGWYLTVGAEPRQLARTCYDVAREMIIEREGIDRGNSLAIVAVRYFGDDPTGEFEQFERVASLEIHDNLMLAAARLASGLHGVVRIRVGDGAPIVTVEEGRALWVVAYAEECDMS